MPPTQATNLEISIDYGQFYVYDEKSPTVDIGEGSAERALNDALSADRQVGAADGLIAVCVSVQWNFNAPMRVETWDTEPDDDSANWDDVEDVDLDLPSGRLAFLKSGDNAPPTICDVPPGHYRARIGGRGYDLSDRAGGGLDDYRVQLWPRSADSPLAVVKVWKG